MKLEKTNNTDAGLAQEPATQNAYAETSAGRGSYWQLNPVFRELIDIYRDSGKKRGLKESTIYKTSLPDNGAGHSAHPVFFWRCRTVAGNL